MNMTPRFHGLMTALVTPFRDGAVDETAYAALVERQIDAGVHGLVANGTTGETATLSESEQKRVIALCVEAARGRVPVVAGCGSNDTAKALSLLQHAKAIGADAAMIVTPYYNKPNQAGLEAHFTALADGVQLPQIVYNVPARTNVDLLPETLATLARHPNIIGIKDASNQLERVAMHRRGCGAGFILLSGEDSTAIGFNALGGQGLISVTANVAPELCARAQEAALAGDFGAAQDINALLSPLHKALFLEPNPAPAKAALALLGLCRDDVRLPLVAANAATREALRSAMAEARLL
jgi:4-hydroxy-tetrahydrodipicolinate synthase